MARCGEVAQPLLRTLSVLNFEIFSSEHLIIRPIVISHAPSAFIFAFSVVSFDADMSPAPVIPMPIECTLPPILISPAPVIFATASPLTSLISISPEPVTVSFGLFARLQEKSPDPVIPAFHISETSETVMSPEPTIEALQVLKFGAVISPLPVTFNDALSKSTSHLTSFEPHTETQSSSPT